MWSRPRTQRRYNSLENPIGIETVVVVRPGLGADDWLQLIRKPDRDWNTHIAGSASAMGKLQLIRKPDRDWNNRNNMPITIYGLGYNSLENPIGIETKHQVSLQAEQQVCYNSLENPIGIETICYHLQLYVLWSGYNSLENPIGIETSYGICRHFKAVMLQLIRKPDRDWNPQGGLLIERGL